MAALWQMVWGWGKRYDPQNWMSELMLTVPASMHLIDVDIAQAVSRSRQNYYPKVYNSLSLEFGRQLGQ
jgi:hypothetical protein